MPTKDAKAKGFAIKNNTDAEIKNSSSLLGIMTYSSIHFAGVKRMGGFTKKRLCRSLNDNLAMFLLNRQYILFLYKPKRIYIGNICCQPMDGINICIIEYASLE